MKTATKVKKIKVFYWCRGAQTTLWTVRLTDENGEEITRETFAGGSEHVYGGYIPAKEDAVDRAYELCLKNRLPSFDLVVDSYGCGGETEPVFVTFERLKQRQSIRQRKLQSEDCIHRQ